MKQYTPVRSIRIEDEIYLKMKEIAKADGRSYNNYVVQLFKKHITEYEKENGEIEIDTDSLYD